MATFIAGIAIASAGGFGASVSGVPAKRAPAVIELNDQFNAPQRLAFPATNLTVLTIADKQAQPQVDAWADALTTRYRGRADLRGMADTSGLPGIPQWLIRRDIRKTRKYPVLLDWSGQICAQLGFQPGVANVFVLDQNGFILGHVTGEAAETNRAAVFEIVDRALKARTP